MFIKIYSRVPCIRMRFQTLKPPIRQINYRHSNQKQKTAAIQKFDNFLVLDFEATCEKNVMIVPQEIIEFPCIHVHGQTLDVVSKFHCYVKPNVNRTLTPFCTELTGILQDMVDDEHTFDRVLPVFINWLQRNNLMDPRNTIFVTSGDWDLQVMLPDQCQLSKLDVPAVMTSWINIKKSFCKATGHFPRNIPDMLTRLSLDQVGRLHSGIDDSHNICLILQALGRKGFVFEKTSKS